MLTLLDVGLTPVHLALKPDGGEIFVSNFGSDSISEISTWTNEVGGTYTIGSQPVHGVVSADNSTLWVSNFGADSISLYSIDDGKLVGSVHTGSAPDALAFSADQHLLLAADAHSGDVSVIRTQGRGRRTLHHPPRRQPAQCHRGQDHHGQTLTSRSRVRGLVRPAAPAPA